MKRRLVVFTSLIAISLISLLVVVRSAPAQTKTLEWNRWDVTIDINADGTFDIKEVYEIEFIGGDFTFGFRDIPISQYEELTDFRVSEVGVGEYSESRRESANTFYVEQNSREYVVSWFYPPTWDQTREFVVEYTVHGGIIINAEVGDRFFWKAVGPDHDYSIGSSTVVVNLPPGATVDPDLEPFVYGVSGADYTIVNDGASVIFEAQNIGSGREFEVGVRFPHGFVPDEIPAWQAAYEREQALRDQAQTYNLLLGGAGVLVLIASVLGVIGLWLFLGRDPDVGAVPDYLSSPPSDLPPGLAGTLVDEKADLQDIIATVIDLARRGVLSMEERESKILGVRVKNDYVFRRVDDHTETLREYEDRLIRDMFGTRSEIDLDDLQEKFYQYIPGLQRRLYKEAVAEGLFPASPKAIRGRYLGFGIAGLVVSIASGFCATAAGSSAFPYISQSLICPFIGLGVGAIALMIASGAMPAKSRKGAEEAAKWRAFKKYLEQIERYEDLNNVGELFDQYLPYAIAFGLEKAWIKKFSRTNTTPIPRWYVPMGGHYYPGRVGSSGTMGDIGLGKEASGSAGGRDLRGEAVRPGTLDRMSQGMSGGLEQMSSGLISMLNSTASTFTSVPHSSSSGGGFSSSGGGFSGGGFSGGGGGGGGGAGFG